MLKLNMNFFRSKIFLNDGNAIKSLIKFPLKNFYFQESSHGAGELNNKHIYIISYSINIK